MENFVGSLGPDEGFRILVVDGEVVLDSALEFTSASEGPAADLLSGQGGEESFDQVDPGSAGRGEVHVEARPLRQPASDHGGFVSAVVVGDEMDVERSRDVGIDGVEELAELGGSVASMTLADHLAGGDIKAAKSEVVPCRT